MVDANSTVSEKRVIVSSTQQPLNCENNPRPLRAKKTVNSMADFASEFEDVISKKVLQPAYLPIQVNGHSPRIGKTVSSMQQPPICENNPQPLRTKKTVSSTHQQPLRTKKTVSSTHQQPLRIKKTVSSTHQQPLRTKNTVSSTHQQPTHESNTLDQHAKIMGGFASEFEEVINKKGSQPAYSSIQVNGHPLRTKNTSSSTQQPPICESNPHPPPTKNTVSSTQSPICENNPHPLGTKNTVCSTQQSPICENNPHPLRTKNTVSSTQQPPICENIPHPLPIKDAISSTQQLPICENSPPNHNLQSAKGTFHSKLKTTASNTIVVPNDPKQKKSFPICSLKIDHSAHHHPLVLQRAQAPYDCHGCKEKGFRKCFKCTDDNCNGFYFHDECAEAKPDAHHKFFPDCALEFHKEAPARKGGGEKCYCSACGMVVQGFRYQCLHEVAHHFHPACLKLPFDIDIDDNDGIKLQLQDKVGSNCLRCGKEEVLKGIKGWTYAYTSSWGDQYCYHISCFKEIIYENWKEAFLKLSSDGGPSYYEGSSSLPLFPSISDKKIVSHEKDNKQIARPKKDNKRKDDKQIVKRTKYSKASLALMVAKVILKLIMSVLTGGVSNLILDVVGLG